MHRRYVLKAAAATSLTPAVTSAANLLLTPYQPRGPFYPVELPLDHDNDLVTVNGGTKLAHGEICNVVGTVTDETGVAAESARVEIWQCDSFGRYHHPSERRSGEIDENFQGYGETLTDENGAYRFRTIKPVAYPGRAPHIHFAVTTRAGARLVTQLYVAGASQNDRDALLRRVTDDGLREQIVRPFETDLETPNTLRCHFDIVVSVTGSA